MEGETIQYFLFVASEVFFMAWEVSFCVINSTLIRILWERGSSDKLLRCI